MRQIEGLDALLALDLPSLVGDGPQSRSVVAVGVFDGVHLGHLRLLHELLEMTSRLPGVPTVKELGIPHVSSGWLGFAAPAGIPADVRQKLIQAFQTAARDPEIVAKFEAAGIESRSTAGDAFAARVKREIEELRELNKDLKIALD